MEKRESPDLLKLIRAATTPELAASGVTEAMVRTMVKKGTLLRVGRGIYVPGPSANGGEGRGAASAPGRNPSGAPGRAPGGPGRGPWAPVGLPTADRPLLVAAALRVAGNGAVASYQDAAVLHGIDLLDRPPPGIVAVTRPPGSPGSRTARHGIGLHLAALPAGQVSEVRGIPVTSAARTVVDLARTVPFRAGVVTADSALHRRLTTKDEVMSVIAACGGWPGIVRAREVIEFSDALSESPFESIARVAFRDWGLPPPRLQVVVGGDFEIIGRVDFLWSEHHTIAEADGMAKYADPDLARRQLERDARLRAAGYEVVHFFWRDLINAPELVHAAILAAFERAAALRRARLSRIAVAQVGKSVGFSNGNS